MPDADAGRIRSSPVSLRRVLFFAAVVASLAAVGAWVAELRIRAAALRSQAVFYGRVGGEWPDDGALVLGDGVTRQFPMVFSAPATPASRAPHLRLRFDAEKGYAVRVRLAQFENHDTAPPRLALALNDGARVDVATRAGSGRNPVTIEHGSGATYDVVLPGRSRCGRNEIEIPAKSGEWIALERIEIGVAAVRGVRPGARAAFAAAAIAWLLVLAHSAFVVGATFGPRRVGARLALLGLACALGLAIAEGSLALAGHRLAGARRFLYSSRDPEEVSSGRSVLETLAAHRCAQEPCSRAECGFRHNRHGFHTHDYARTKPSGTVRVLGIGDSFMFSGGPVPHRDEWFVRLQAQMEHRFPDRRFEFINLGFLCIGVPTESAILLDEGLRLDPDLVIWSLYLGNDLTDEQGAAEPASHAAAAPARPWWDRLLVTRLAGHVAQQVSRDPRFLFPGCRRASPPPAAHADACGVLDVPEVPYDPTAKSFTDDAFREYGVGRLRGLYARERLPWVRGLVETLIARFAALRPRLARTRVVLVVIPDEFQVSPEAVAAVRRLEPALVTEDLELGDTAEAVPEGLRRLGMDVLDLTPPLRAAIARHEGIYQPYDGHLSAAGNRRVAELVEERVAAMRLSP
jgi:hypothetical protein